MCWIAGCAWLFSLVGAEGVQFRQQIEYAVPAHAVESNEVWVAAESIQVSGHVEQAFFGVARTAALDGQFDRDVWLVAERVRARPQLDQSLRVIAQNDIQFDGHVSGNWLGIAGKSIELGAQSRVAGNVLVMAPKVIITGHVKGDVRALSRNVIVAGRIDGNLNARPAQLHILPGAHVGGDIRHRDDRVDEMEAVTAPPPRARRPREPGKLISRETAWIGGGWLGQVYFFAATLLGGLFFLALMPDYAGRSVRCVRRSFWKSLASGAIWFVLIPLGLLLISFTLIGLPVAIVLALLYGVLLYTSRMVVAVAIGGILLRRRGLQSFGAATAALVLGLLFLYLGVNIPIIGAWVKWIIMLAGLGGLLLGMRPAPVPATSPPPLPLSKPNQ